MKIKQIDAWQIFDSRGNPTLEVEVELKNGIKGNAMVPSGASTGKFEALELRDKIKKKFHGKSVTQAIENVKCKLSPILKNRDVHEQNVLDKLMIDLDGTTNKQHLGANTIVGVSMAIARASAKDQNISLYQSLSGGKGNLIPLPEIQIIGGGVHSSGRIDIQDYMIICTGASSFNECLEMTYNIYKKCGEILKIKGKLAGVADEGGYWPVFSKNEDVFEIIIDAIEMSGYKPGIDVHLSLDIAASELYSEGQYYLNLENRAYTPDQFYELIESWCRNYPIISIEDPFSESDINNWIRITKNLGHKIQIIGDDLFTTNTNRVQVGIEKKLANSVLIKPNQIGTVTEAIECIQRTQSHDWTAIVSARSGETEDPFISHLAVAFNAGQLKVGSLCRSERTVKWNEIIRITRELGKQARYVGGGLIFPGKN